MAKAKRRNERTNHAKGGTQQLPTDPKNYDMPPPTPVDWSAYAGVNDDDYQGSINEAAGVALNFLHIHVTDSFV